jgi:hypothetical protein
VDYQDFPKKKCEKNSQSGEFYGAYIVVELSFNENK